MATERQVASNQRNALLSTGPTTTEGKARSRANALKHGLAADTLIIDSIEAEFAERKAEWEQTYKPTTAEGRFALEAVVACTFRIEECRRNINTRLDIDITRACLVWDVDREADVAVVASQLARQPALVSRQLKCSKHGVELILRLWDLLGESLDTKKGAWSDAEVSTAFDLLGIPSHLRDGRAPFDPAGPGEDVYQHRRDFVFGEGDRLRAHAAALGQTDRRDREHAETGGAILGTKPVVLLLRYERQAWQRYDLMLKAVTAATSQESSIPEAEPEQDVADSGSALDVEVHTPTASRTTIETQEIAADIRSELSHPGYPVPNEPNSARGSKRPLNRHQRRKLDSKARKQEFRA
jgi:hypothetical protein